MKEQGVLLMGSAADYTIIVFLVAMSVGLWSMYDRIVQLQRDLDAVKKSLGAQGEAPSDPG